MRKKMPKKIKEKSFIRGECIGGCGRQTLKIRGGECRKCRRQRLVKGGRIIQKLRQEESKKRRGIK